MNRSFICNTFLFLSMVFCTHSYAENSKFSFLIHKALPAEYFFPLNNDLKQQMAELKAEISAEDYLCFEKNISPKSYKAFLDDEIAHYLNNYISRVPRDIELLEKRRIANTHRKLLGKTHLLGKVLVLDFGEQANQKYLLKRLADINESGISFDDYLMYINEFNDPMNRQLFEFLGYDFISYHKGAKYYDFLESITKKCNVSELR